MADRAKDADQREQESQQADATRNRRREAQDKKWRRSPKCLLKRGGGHYDLRCGFRAKWGTDSDMKWGGNSSEVGRGFDGKWALLKLRS